MRKCDKCRAVGEYDALVCADCGKDYARCEGCGGVNGAKRSLHSHRALHHSKNGGW